MESSARSFRQLNAAQWRGNPSFVWRAGQERRLRLVRRHVELRGARVLDAGCGVGMYTLAFAGHGAEAYGVEIEPARAREAAETLHTISVASVTALPYPDGCFDMIFSHEVLEHVDDEGAAMREMARVVRPGGRVVLFVPNRWYLFETHGIVWQGSYRFGNFALVNYLPTAWRNRLVPHARAYTGRQIRRLFEQVGLRIVLHRRIYPGFDNIVARRPGLGRLLRMLCHTLERTPLSFFGLSHFVVAERPT